MKGKDLIQYIVDYGLQDTPVGQLFRTSKDIAKESGITSDGVRARARRGKLEPLFKLGDGGELFFPVKDKKEGEKNEN